MAWKRLAALCALVGVLALAGVDLRAGPGDYPGWRGADRSGVSAETGLLTEWPKDGPKLLWKATGLGGGYSTPSVSNGRLYTMGGRDDQEYLIALDVEGGKQVWSTKVGAVGKNFGPQYPGPRATPTVDGERIYTLGSDGDLVCAETAGGKIVWHKNLQREFGGRRGSWAYAESSLIDGDVLVCTPGGTSATMAALDKKTGNVIWKAAIPGRNEAAYSSVVIAKAGDVKQYVNFVSGGLVGVSAKDGKLLWTYAKTISPTATIPTPIAHEGYVFSSAGGSKGGGGAVVQLVPDDKGVSAKEVFFNSNLGSHIGGFVRVGDHLYGANNSQLMCVEFKTGQMKWQDRCVGKGSVAAADGHLYVRSEDGVIALVEAAPGGYKEKGRFTQPERSGKRTWPYPVIANGRLYLRDYDLLFCYDVKAK